MVSGVANNTTANSGGVINVRTGGSVSGTLLNAGRMNLAANTSASNTTISNAGYLNVSGTGIHLDSTTLNGGLLIMNGQGSTASNTTINSGGDVRIGDGIIIQGATVNKGGMLQAVWNDTSLPGIVNDVVIDNGGILNINNKGVANNITQKAGAILRTDTSTTVTGTNENGAFSIKDNAAENVIIEKSGYLTVLENGKLINSKINGGTLALTKGNILQGKNSIANGSVLSAASKSVVNDGELYISPTDAMFAYSGALTGSGSLVKDGNGLARFVGDVSQKGGIKVLDGILELSNAKIIADITGSDSGMTRLMDASKLTGKTQSGSLVIDSGSIWNMTNSSTLDFLNLGGNINFVDNDPLSDGTIVNNAFTPKTLTVKNIFGEGGTISLNTRLEGSKSTTDQIIIDGGNAAGTTGLAIINQGGLGAQTTGNGIEVVNAVNGATTSNSAFSLKNNVEAGAYKYSLVKGSQNESWYLTTQKPNAGDGSNGSNGGSDTPNYRSAAYLYNSLFSNAMDYDGMLVGSLDSRGNGKLFSDESETPVWGKIQAGQIQHRNGSKDLKSGNTPDSTGNYSFLQIGSDLHKSNFLTMNWINGIYGATGVTDSDIDRESGTRAGTVKDKIYSFGTYMTGVAENGMWVDAVLQASRHNFEANAVNSSGFSTKGWGYTASLETGLPFSISESLFLEPQLQYQYKELDIDSKKDSVANVDFGKGSSHQARIGLKLSNGTLTFKPNKDSNLLSWWVRPSVVQTFGSKGNVNISATDVDGSNVSFKPKQDGTSLALDVGLENQVAENVTVGFKTGYSQTLKDAAAGGFGGQLNLKVTF